MKWIRDLIMRLGIGIFIVFIMAFPILGFIQWFGPDNAVPYDKYKELLSESWVHVNKYGDWAIVFFLTVFLMGAVGNYHLHAEQVRMRRLNMEYKRWRKTPYISPYIYFNLISPRGALSNELKSIVYDEHYKQVVSMFRNRVFVNGSFSNDSPEKKPNWIQVAGLSIIVPTIFCVALVMGFFIIMWQVKSPNLWFTGWEKFAIPFIAFVFTWLGNLLYASFHIGSFRDIKEDMDDYFQEEEPKITWRDVYPDRKKGQTILLAWKHETKDRQEKFREYQTQMNISPAAFIECPALAPYPFPSNEIPEWADGMEEDIYNSIGRWKEDKMVHQQKVINQSKGKVVSFNKKRR
ncbi:hypothetical protein [Oceanobacillus salinisoli]|uniref:hypothetical protein n=1 Tax=Oceanobacillus salinisoli TaxID=2678611 RepID=UPI0012E0DB9A|nr:hypothetical protein [Oceanobacillus salinisoli]